MRYSTVVRDTHGTPIVNAAVTLRAFANTGYIDLAFEPLRDERTDENGCWVLRDIEPGTHRLRIHARAQKVVTRVSLELPQGSLVEHKAELTAGVTLVGRVQIRGPSPPSSLAPRLWALPENSRE